MVDMLISTSRPGRWQASPVPPSTPSAIPRTIAHRVRRKVRIADACRRVSREAIQLHGGMGMSDELKVSHTFRRLTSIAQQFGDADHHLERFTLLSNRSEGGA
jgi:alkylation response protein AidB-like acyl-CoA dehydrogenase